ncbi:MAG: hypothetical protein ACRC76_07545 [Proteocatella sp.]
MLINTRYSTIYNTQKSQSIKAISEKEEQRNSGKYFSANFQDSAEKYKNSENNINNTNNNLVTKDITSAIENIKFFSDGDKSKMKFAIEELYEAESIRYAIKESNFVDLSDEIEEIKSNEKEDDTSAYKEFSERGIWYDSNDFEKSMAYRETIEDKVLESNVIKLKHKKGNTLTKENFLSEIEQERFGFNNRKVI